MKTASAPVSKLLRQAWSDLQPFEGRFGQAWRVALLCALVTGVAMTLKIPEAAISCYLVIFLMKPDAVMNSLMGIGLIGLATLVVFLMIPVINFSIDSAAMRLLIMFSVSYVFLFLSSTTPLGEQAAIVGLIVAFIMTLVPDVAISQIGDQGLLAAWKMACMPMALMVVFNLLLGIPEQTHVRNLVVARLKAAALELEEPGSAPDLAELLADGNGPALQKMLLVRVLHLVPKAESDWLNGALESSYAILLASCAPGNAFTPEDRSALVAALRAAAGQVQQKDLPTLHDLDCTEGPATSIRNGLAGLAQPDGGGNPKPISPPLLAPDSFTNPKHQRYALKTSIAAVLCYLIYTGLQWDGIHTALITCYVAALGTTGETVRKLTLRITGCLLGAFMGCVALLFIMPQITSVGALMVMVFLAILVAAWVSSGSERISYCGVQIALAFLLTTLNGFGPSFEFSQAGDRILGILLGIFVIYIIFTQFWPTSIVDEIRSSLKGAVERLTSMSALSREERAKELDGSAEVLGAVFEMEEKLSMAEFEPRHERASATELARLDDIRTEIAELQKEVRFSDTIPDSIKSRLRELFMELSEQKVG